MEKNLGYIVISGVQLKLPNKMVFIVRELI